MADDGERLQDLESQSSPACIRLAALQSPSCCLGPSCCLDWMALVGEEACGITSHPASPKSSETMPSTGSFPQCVGEPASGHSAQSQVFTANIAEAVRSHLLFQVKLHPSVLECSDSAQEPVGESEMSGAYLLGEKCSVDTRECQSHRGRHPSTLGPQCSGRVLFAHDVCLECSAI